MTETLTAEQIEKLERRAITHTHRGAAWGAFTSGQILTLIAMAKTCIDDAAVSAYWKERWEGMAESAERENKRAENAEAEIEKLRAILLGLTEKEIRSIELGVMPLLLDGDDKVVRLVVTMSEAVTRAEIAESDLADMAKHAMTLEEILAVHENYQAWLRDTTALAKQRNEANYRAENAEAEAARYREMAVRLVKELAYHHQFAQWHSPSLEDPDIAALLSEPKS